MCRHRSRPRRPRTRSAPPVARAVGTTLATAARAAICVARRVARASRVEFLGPRDPSEVGADRGRVAFCTAVGAVFLAVDGFVVEQVHVLGSGDDQRGQVLILQRSPDGPDASDLARRAGCRSTRSCRRRVPSPHPSAGRSPIGPGRAPAQAGCCPVGGWWRRGPRSTARRGRGHLLVLVPASHASEVVRPRGRSAGTVVAVGHGLQPCSAVAARCLSPMGPTLPAVGDDPGLRCHDVCSRAVTDTRAPRRK